MASMITFHVPEDHDLLAAFEVLSLRHEHLNYILRMTIKTLGGLSVEEALDATAYDGSARLRERINKLARQRLGEGQPLLRLQAILERCRRATEKRNELIHNVWAKELDGEAFRKGSDHSRQPLPSVQELQNLTQEIESLTHTLNAARVEGFLAEALSRSRSSSQTRDA